MEREYLSIRDFAKCAGRSRQAVYQQLHTVLKDYVKVNKGQKYIDRKALKEVYELDVDVDSTLQSFADNDNQVCKVSEAHKDDKYIQSLESQIDYLRQQLAVKDSQIDKLNDALERTTITLSQQQSLNMETLKQLEDLKAKEAEPEQDQPEQKRGFFRRFRK